MHFTVIRRPKVILTSTNLDDLSEEIKTLLNDFVDIIVDELPNALPPIMSISHHIDLIPGASLPYKAAYKLTPQENAEVGRQVHFIRESLSPCAIPTVLSPKKGGEWHMCTDSRAINKITIRDTKFVRHFWRNLWKKLGANLSFSSEYHPQTYGQTEVVNRSLGKILRSLVYNNPKQWNLALSQAEFVYNDTPNQSTGMSPVVAQIVTTTLRPGAVTLIPDLSAQIVTTTLRPGAVTLIPDLSV
eukprot:PITA_08950